MRGGDYLVTGQGRVEAGDEGVSVHVQHGPGVLRVQCPHQGALGPYKNEHHEYWPIGGEY